MVTVHSAITPRGISDLGGFEDSSASAVKVVFPFTTFYCSEFQPLAGRHAVLSRDGCGGVHEEVRTLHKLSMTVAARNGGHIPVSWECPQRFPASFEPRIFHLRQSTTADADTPRVDRTGFLLHTAGRGGPDLDEDRRAQSAPGWPVRHCRRSTGPIDELRAPGWPIAVRSVHTIADLRFARRRTVGHLSDNCVKLRLGHDFVPHLLP